MSSLETDQSSAPNAASGAESTPNAPRYPALLRPGTALLALLLLVGIFLLPGISSFGLWDPHEVRLVEGASEPIPTAELWKPANAIRPRLPLLAIKYGLSVFGTSELGARLPMALLALAICATVFLHFAWRGRVRAGLLAGVVLLTTPTLFLGARQASLHLLPMLGQLLAITGLSALCLPRQGRAVVDGILGLVLAVIGCAIGLLTTGSMMGIAVPAIAVAVTLALTEGPLAHELFLTSLAGLGLAMPLRQILVVTQLRSSLVMGLGVALLVLGLLGALLTRRPIWLLGSLIGVALFPALPSSINGYSGWLAGIPRWPPHRDMQADSLLKTLGFSLFPWVALVPAALAQLFDPPTSEPSAKAIGASDSEPETAAGSEPPLLSAFPSLLLLSWLAVGYLLHTLQTAIAQEMAFASAPAVALLVGNYLDRLLDGRRAPLAAAVCSGLLAVFIARDFFFGPEQYLSAQLTELLKWPAVQAGTDPLISQGGQIVSTLGILLAVVFGLGLFWNKRRAVWLLPASAALLSLFAMHGLVPAVTRHVSYRGIYTKYEKLGGGDLGLYGVQKSSARIYGQKSVEIPSLADLFTFLTKDPQKRAFAIVGAGEMAALDVHSFQNNLPYYVVDDSNSQFLLLSNRLGPGEKDLNPLRRLVSTQKPQIQTELHATFDDKIELIGYEIPTDVQRGTEFVIKLHYQVLAPVLGNYRVFLHFDGPSARINGDHIPLGGKYPTNYWTRGQYITDEYRMSTSRLNQSAGYYTVFTGFWPGGDGARMKVTQGPHEPDNRVRLSAVRVK